MKLPWYIKPGNKVLVAVSRAGIGFGDKGPVVLTVTGRKSGKPRSTPVTPMVVDGKRYVAGLPGTSGSPMRGPQVRPRCAADVAPNRSGSSSFPSTNSTMLRRLPTEVPGWIGFLRGGGLVTDGTQRSSRHWPTRCRSSGSTQSPRRPTLLAKAASRRRA